MTMKIFCKLLVLSVFHHWRSTAFFVPAPKTSKALHAYDLLEPPGYATHWTGEDSIETFLRPRVPTRSPLTRYNRPQQARERIRSWDTSDVRPQERQRNGDWWDRSEHVQGGSRQTWSSDYDRMNVQLRSESRHSPLYSNVELWDGPDNTPQSMRLYSEDGYSRPIQAGFETRGRSTMSVRNTGPMEFPMTARVQGAYSQSSRRSDYGRSDYGRSDYNSGRVQGGHSRTSRRSDYGMSQTVQGGSLRTFSFAPYVDSVEVELRTDGLPLMATVELWQGPDNIKQIADVYSDDGTRPFFALIDTYGYESTIAVRNTGPVEFPLVASLSAS